MSSGDGGEGVEIESAASQVMQIISFNLLLKITQSQVKEGLYGLSHCYCRGVTDLGCIRRAAEEEEELQQILTCWKSLPARVAGWARDCPGVVPGQRGLQGWQLPTKSGAYAVLVPGKRLLNAHLSPWHYQWFILSAGSKAL